MATITFSPLIVAASGKVKDTVFSRWKGRPYIRSRVTPANPKSTDQVKQRAISTAGVTLWQNLHADLIPAWNAYASPYSISGYNAAQKRNTSTATPNGDGTFARMELAATQAIALMQATPGCAPLNNFAGVAGASGVITVSWDVDSWQGEDDLYLAAFPEAGITYYGPPGVPMDTTTPLGGSTSISGLTPAAVYTIVGIIFDDSEGAWSAAVCDKAVSAGA